MVLVSMMVQSAYRTPIQVQVDEVNKEKEITRIWVDFLAIEVLVAKKCDKFNKEMLVQFMWKTLKCRR